MKDNKDINWHSLNIDEVLEKLNTTIGGLTQEEARERLNTHGYNEFEGEEKVTPFQLIIQQFFNSLDTILYFSADLWQCLPNKSTSFFNRFLIKINWKVHDPRLGTSAGLKAVFPNQIHIAHSSSCFYC